MGNQLVKITNVLGVIPMATSFEPQSLQGEGGWGWLGVGGDGGAWGGGAWGGVDVGGGG